jgi:hypothetical protein
MQLNDLQALLVRRAITTRDHIRHAVTATHGTGVTWIEYLVLGGHLDDEIVARCVVRAAGVPSCDVARLSRIPPMVVALVPADLALEHRLVPVAIEPDGDVSLAMVDPTDQAAVEEVGFFLGRHVLREVARATAIAWALHAYYRANSALYAPLQSQPALAATG